MSALEELVNRKNWQIGTVVVIGGDNRYSAEYIGDNPPIDEAAAELAALRERVAVSEKIMQDVKKYLELLYLL